MRLEADDGAVLELRVTGYQFADLAESDVPDWDANWLEIAGDVRLADGAAWSFESPLLTTWEARELAAWLTASANRSGAGRLTFTEPNLAFDVNRSGRSLTLTVALSHESGPPLEAGAGTAASYDLVLALDPATVTAAAVQWERELAAFPIR